MLARIWAWQQKKSEQCPMGRQILQGKRSAVGRLALLVWSFPEALCCFCCLEISVLFSFEAAIDLVLSALWVNDETGPVCMP